MISKRNINPPHQVVSLRLFGSVARGDADSTSDLDVLGVLDTSLIRDVPKNLVDELETLFGKRVSMSWYSLNRIAEMFRAGHLFAWHLFLESIPLTEDARSDEIKKLGRPTDYDAAEEDIDSLIDILKSIPDSLAKCPENSIYEAGIVFVCLRNIALCASWFSPSGLDFSRHSPYNLESSFGWKFPLCRSDYDALIKCRLSGQRGFYYSGEDHRKVISIHSEAMKWARQVIMFIREMSK